MSIGSVLGSLDAPKCSLQMNKSIAVKKSPPNMVLLYTDYLSKKHVLVSRFWMGFSLKLPNQIKDTIYPRGAQLPFISLLQFH
jgi:hypothetical protein